MFSAIMNFFKDIILFYYKKYYKLSSFNRTEQLPCLCYILKVLRHVALSTLNVQNLYFVIFEDVAPD